VENVKLLSKKRKKQKQMSLIWELFAKPPKDVFFATT
jgi:hypothetical protein